MENNRLSDMGTSFLSYLNDTGETISGYFQILEITQAFIKVQTRAGVLIIPFHRVLKIKERN